MAPRIAEGTLLEVQRANDIVDVVQEYLPLKRSGTSFVALCPFHTEKTPSFHVIPKKQMYYCFGCGKGGNVFGFVMAHDRLTFPEAVRVLAQKRGIRLAVESEASRAVEREREDLLKFNRWAAEFYHRRLLEAQDAARGLEYIRGRGLSQGTLARWWVGSAPATWDGLLRAGKSAGHPEALLEKAGLIQPRRNNPGYIDRFRDRVMFPIFDPQDRVVGFGGRVLPDTRENDAPKYLNTPETAVFHKGRLLYGLNFARQAAEAAGSLAVVEGYTDVIIAHQAGVENVVAPLGTALTREHVRELKRFAPRIVLVFDGDEAGQKASSRALDLVLEEDVAVRVATLTGGEDPCDCILKHGVEKFREAIAQARDLFSYRMTALASTEDLKTVDGRTRAIDAMLGNILLVRNGVRRDELLRELADAFKGDERVLRARLKELQTAPRYGAESEGGTTPAGSAGPISKDERLARELLGVILAEPRLIPEVRAVATSDRFPTKATRRLAEAVYRAFEEHGTLSAAELLTLVADGEDQALLLRIEEETGGRPEPAQERLAPLMGAWQRRQQEERLAVLKNEISEAARRGDDDARRKAQADYQALSVQLKKGTRP